jgi:translation initiation factor IF-2
VKGTIIEARQEIGRGTVATVLVQAGTLKVGDIFVCGPESGRVRSMLDHNGNKITTAYPSTPVEITGLNAIPTAGDDFVVMLTEAEAREVAFRRADILRQKEALALAGGPISLEEFAKMAERAEAFELNLVIKADVQGSLEAVSDAVSKLSTDKVRVKVVHGAVGGVIESDVQLAIASKALIIGFGVRGEPRALAEAESRGIEVRFYRVIYELMDDVKKAMAGLLPPIRKEVSLGRAEVRDTFAVPKIGVVAGCYITEGMVKRGAQLRLVRDSRVVYEGKMLSLRRFKDDVKEVQTGYECGISFEGYNDIKAGDVIEAFEIKEEVATL